MDTKVALVTAASQGIGLACAEQLATQGYTLVVMSRSAQIHGVAEKLGAVGLVGSVTDASDLAKMVKTAIDKYGRIDAVVNNTGHPVTKELELLEDGDWLNGFELMLMNVIRMSSWLAPIMKKQTTGGSIVNISTYAAVEPSLVFPISSTIRGALSNYTKLYSDRYAADKIRMNNVLPGFVDNFPISDEELKAIPMRRGCPTTEVAQVVGFLLSSASAYITGQNIRVDGGITRSV